MFLADDARRLDPRGQPRILSWLAFGFLFALFAQRLAYQRDPYVVDDAAFFYRYAENIAAGHGWRWNIEEPPVWGASAPLWPPVVALGIKAGLSAVDSALIWS